ncbi:polyprenol monophosphomannose synthase [Diaminobutyricimonas sp. LJ205]|uniref:polyprenol monophosphomannose synthase n=1 Tax=Diaminobutyricimonas sp. LJ205 TaxID=2683590 RepID=UPI0012F52037|nr:polyprenol monophosphomannose synthase [Diaminobutyricimonas sp. LJ205]
MIESSRGPAAARVLVITPTYNEKDNLAPVLERLFTAQPTVDVLVVDDNSPDGTGRVADGMAASDPRIQVLHRGGKQGLGAAYLAGFRWGLEHGYDVIVEMDADGSHPPSALAAMLTAVAEGAGLAIGSRWVPGGQVVNWAWPRRWLSRAGNGYTRIALRIPVRDATAGFRAYRADVLRQLPLEDVHSRGYCFQVDMALRVLDAGHRVAETPIIFREREHGESKMSGAIVFEAMARVTWWGLRRRFGRRTR